MLKKIISITGKPGLYRILSQGRGILIVESLVDGHRFPVHARDKVVSLGDITMYTESGDTPLDEILEKLYAAESGNPIDIKGMSDRTAFHDKFGSVIEDYDRERVRDSDIKKLFSWYNILIGAGMTEFVEKKEETERKEAPEASTTESEK